MLEIVASRDLYCFIVELVKRHAESAMPLQDYLENLRRLGRQLGDRNALSPPDFARLLQTAFDAVPTDVTSRMTASQGYLAWQQRVEEQVSDLREMEEAGTLENEYRYFGMAAPSGAQWFNFDPCTYLECAAAGTFGGWREGDDSRRSYVPGRVAVLDRSGRLTSADPRDLGDVIVKLPEISWEMFVDFLNAGQLYE
jgi:hypothetical protein